MFEEIIEKIKEYGVIIIHRHKNPDGDALGAQIGLCEMLKTAYPEKKIYAVGDGAGRYAFMEGSEMDEVEDSLYENALAIVLDTSAAALISDGRYTNAAATARIDHHIFVEKICDIEVTDTSYESCCGLVTDFAIECGFNLSPIAAKALYTLCFPVKERVARATSSLTLSIHSVFCNDSSVTIANASVGVVKP